MLLTLPELSLTPTGEDAVTQTITIKHGKSYDNLLEEDQKKRQRKVVFELGLEGGRTCPLM